MTHEMCIPNIFISMTMQRLVCYIVLLNLNDIIIIIIIN